MRCVRLWGLGSHLTRYHLDPLLVKLVSSIVLVYQLQGTAKNSQHIVHLSVQHHCHLTSCLICNHRQESLFGKLDGDLYTDRHYIENTSIFQCKYFWDNTFVVSSCFELCAISLQSIQFPFCSHRIVALGIGSLPMSCNFAMRIVPSVCSWTTSLLWCYKLLRRPSFFSYNLVCHHTGIIGKKKGSH